MKELKIKKNAALLPGEEPRNKWPFANMKINDVVEINGPKDWKGASKYAHTVSSRYKWKIQTNWLAAQKIGRIRRLA